jgi:hypothetical protein
MGKPGCHIITEIIINRSPEEVRKICLDFGKYPEWNPSLLTFEVVSGNIDDVENTKPVIKSLMATPGWSTTTYTMKIEENSPSRFSFYGSLLSLVVTRYFKYEKLDNKSTKFIQGEIWSGFGSGLCAKIFDQEKIRKGLVEMNQALKARCEGATK